MANKVIFFGNGASLGSGDVNFPLRTCLFKDLCEYSSEWNDISYDLKAIFEKDFEKGMVELFKRDPYQAPKLQRIMAKYFFQFKPRQDNLYYKLAFKMGEKKWKGSLVTINYERLLQLSLNAVGLQYNIYGIRNTSGAVTICLPHGSCNLFCSVKAQGNVRSKGVHTEGKVEEIKDSVEFGKEIDENKFPPVMSYFEPNKMTMSARNFTNEHRKYFERLINGASVVAIVGVKVRIHDKHIWDPLMNTNAKLIYCSGKEDGEQFEKWSKQMRSGKEYENLGGYFKDNFEKLCAFVDLS